MNVLTLQKFPMLLKREFWEHRTTFVYLPFIITVLSIAMVTILAVSLPFVEISVNGESYSSWQDDGGRHERQEKYVDSDLDSLLGPQLITFSERSMTYKERVLEKFYARGSVLMVAVLWFVMFIYLQGALYEDRKDRSVLFWKSLPVSDTLTVLSKLVTALIVLPLIYLLFIAITHIAFLLMASLVALNQSVDVWATMWAPANIIPRWFDMLGFTLFTALWCLPFYTWILFVSSWAKSAPLAWIMGIPIFILIAEGIFFPTSDVIRSFFGTHSLTFNRLRGGFDSFYLDDLLSMDMFVAALLSVVFITLTIWQRGRANEI